MKKFQRPSAISKPIHPLPTTSSNLIKKFPQYPSSSNVSLNQSQCICIYNKKGPKKKKTFIDGNLIINNDKIILKDLNSTSLQIASIRFNSKIHSNILIGSTIDVGPYEVEVLEVNNNNVGKTNVSTSNSNTGEHVSNQGITSSSKIITNKIASSTSRPVFKSLLVNRSNEQKKLIVPHKRTISPPPLLQPINNHNISHETFLIEGGGTGTTRCMKRPRIQHHEIEDPLSATTSDPGMKSLLRVLQPHQMEAVRYMWKNAVSSPMKDNTSYNDDFNSNSNSSNISSRPSSGCILADSMGLGKTLSTIAFIYTCIHHHLASKVVIVVPSSLVENWKNEFSKWLRHFLSVHVNSADRKVLIATAGENKKQLKPKLKSKMKKKKKLGDLEDDDDDDDDCMEINEKELSGVEGVVVEFMKFKAPVLIISYEGFRKHSSLLNNANDNGSKSNVNGSIDMLICDEGHRLKCAQGSKTFSSLKENPSFFKLLLTGTPVQNDLLELYAMVNFVKPGILGNISNFKKEFSESISSGRDLLCSEDEKLYGKMKSNELRSILQSVILRRTAEVLIKSLPPRKELIIFCRLSMKQEECYYNILKSSSLSSFTTNNHNKADVKVNKKPVGHDDEDNLFDSDDDDDDLISYSKDDDQLVNVQEDMNDDVQEDVNASSENKFDKRDALASIHALRMICNHPMLLDKTRDISEKVDISMSSKLQFLKSLLSYMINEPKNQTSSSSSSSSLSSSSLLSNSNTQNRESSASHIERIVIVSNFTSTLNIITNMTLSHGWKVLRIDGSTPPDQRQSLVDRFNRKSESDDAYIFLLSSHAGGVGLNLVGASRLVLFDSDWNPAVDQQTMGRIWRQGQKRPVFIYRLLCTGTLEEKMYQRQIAKGELSCAVEINNNERGGDTEECEDSDVRHFEQEDIRDLFRYNSNIPQCDTFECMRGRWSLDGTQKALNEDKALDITIQDMQLSGSQCQVSYVHLHE